MSFRNFNVGGRCALCVFQRAAKRVGTVDMPVESQPNPRVCVCVWCVSVCVQSARVVCVCCLCCRPCPSHRCALWLYLLKHLCWHSIHINGIVSMMKGKTSTRLLLRLPNPRTRFVLRCVCFFTSMAFLTSLCVVSFSLFPYPHQA